MKPVVSIQLDKIRNLRYGMNALIMIEELLGYPLAKIEENDISMKELRIFVFSGLCHEDKDLTLEQVGDLIDEYSTFEEVRNKMEEAFILAFGKVDKSGKKLIKK